MRRPLLLVPLAPILLASVAFAALAHASPSQQAPPVPSSCQVGMVRSALPAQVLLGDTVQVSLVVTHSCPAIMPPTDIVFLVDVSNSMTKGEAGRIDDPCGPDPGQDPLPTKEPERTPETPGTPGDPPKETPILPGPGLEPTACPTRAPQLPIDPGIGTPGAPGPGPGIGLPTPTLKPLPATPTREGQPPPTPTTGGPGPGPNPTSSGPGPGPIETKPREDPGTEELIREVQQILRQYLREPAVIEAAAADRLRVGLVAFESRPHSIAWPTSKLSRVVSGLGRLDSLPHGTTNAALGYFRAHDALQRAVGGARPSSKIIVVFSDGKFDQRTVRGIRKRSDVTYGAVAMGKAPNLAQLGDVTTDRRYLLTQRDYPELVAFLDSFISIRRPVGLKRLVVQDELASNMSFVTGSAAPTVTVAGQLLEWQIPVPPSPVTITYRVTPLEAGRHPISARAEASWTDGENRVGSGLVPPVDVLVVAPTPTVTPVHTAVPTNTVPPTPTFTATVGPSPTPTATPEPKPLHLPLLFKRWPPAKPACVPQEHTVDVTVVIDTSDSMTQQTGAGRTRMAAALEAAQFFADRLKLDGGGDQVAVVGFNRAPTVASGLTQSRSAVRAALASLPATQATGTRIHLALDAARTIMTGAGRRGSNRPAIILLTDGWHEGSADEVRAAASAARAAGIGLYTIGVGDVDAALLREIATSPDLYFYAPEGEGLQDIYRRIADVVPCP